MKRNSNNTRNDDDTPGIITALLRIAHMQPTEGGEPTYRALAHEQSRLAREALGLLPAADSRLAADGHDREV